MPPPFAVVAALVVAIGLSTAAAIAALAAPSAHVPTATERTLLLPR